MSLLVAQHPISYAERICKIWHLCAIWESTSPETTQPDTWWACICCKKTSRISHESDEGYGLLQQQWKYLLVVYCPIFHCREATKNLLDSPHFDSWPQQKWHGLNYTWFLSAIKCSFPLLMTSNEGYETLQQQWITFLATQHSISRAEMIPQIWYFVCNFRVNLDWNHTVQHILCWLMLSEAPPAYLIHQRKDMKPFSSNGCLLLWHTIPFPVLRGYLKIGILSSIQASTLVDIAVFYP